MSRVTPDHISVRGFASYDLWPCKVGPRKWRVAFRKFSEHIQLSTSRNPCKNGAKMLKLCGIMPWEVFHEHAKLQKIWQTQLEDTRFSLGACNSCLVHWLHPHFRRTFVMITWSYGAIILRKDEAKGPQNQYNQEAKEPSSIQACKSFNSIEGVLLRFGQRCQNVLNQLDLLQGWMMQMFSILVR